MWFFFETLLFSCFSQLEHSYVFANCTNFDNRVAATIIFAVSVYSHSGWKHLSGRHPASYPALHQSRWFRLRQGTHVRQELDSSNYIPEASSATFIHVVSPQMCSFLHTFLLSFLQFPVTLLKCRHCWLSLFTWRNVDFWDSDTSPRPFLTFDPRTDVIWSCLVQLF